MTKGLHKNSLRKGDNPHQWMIDDARMELIQQIKAEVERQMETARKTRINGNTQQAKEADAVIHALRILESRLDTLQEPKEQPFKVGDKVAIVEDRKIYKRGVIEKIGTNKNGTPRVIVSTETSSSWIGHPDLLVFDTLQEQPVRPSVEDAMKELDEKIAKVKKAGSWKNPELLNEMRDEQSICNGSEECEEILDNEIFDWLYNNDCRGWDKYGNIYVSKTDLRNLVKTFINTYHSNQEQPVCEDLEKAARVFASPMAQKDLEHLDEYAYSPADVRAFIAGATWQKEQMMKEAVEGFIFQSEDYYPKELVGRYEGELKHGDKVRIIIVKEDQL